MKIREFFKRFFQPHGVIRLISLIGQISLIKLIRMIAIMGNYSVRQSSTGAATRHFVSYFCHFVSENRVGTEVAKG